MTRDTRITHGIFGELRQMDAFLVPAADDSDRLSARDVGVNSLRALLQLIPTIGPAIEQFAFGGADEVRWRRVERTLREVDERVRRTEREIHVTSERYGALLEGALPHVARAVDEDVRERFRDLLINGAEIPESSNEWNDIKLAQGLLERIDAPGQAIIAALGREPFKSDPPNGGRGVNIVSIPRPQVVLGPFDYANPRDDGTRLYYDWVVLDEWIQRLREMRLIAYGSGDARGGYGAVQLTSLAKLLIRWSLRDDTRPA